MTAPRVLIADKLSPAAVDIFKNRGVDFDIKVGLSKDELIAVIGDYDGIAIRSGAKLDKDEDPPPPTACASSAAPASASTMSISRPPRPRRHRDEHALRQLDHHGRARHRHDVRPGPPDPRRPTSRPRPASGRRTASWASRSRQDARPDRLRQYRLDRRRPRAGPEDEGRGLRPVPQPRARHRDGRREGRAGRPAGSRRRHHPAHPADRQDPQHPVGREPGQDQEGRADRQLRSRRPGR
jgi:hypothetical protein